MEINERCYETSNSTDEKGLELNSTGQFNRNTVYVHIKKNTWKNIVKYVYLVHEFC